MRLALSVTILFSLFSIVVSQETSTSEELSLLKQEVLQLRTEVSQLKIEVQQLRRLLASSPQNSGVTTQQSPRSNYSAPASSTSETGYWCTQSSKKRHNPSCRYYKTSKGRPCGPNDGIACKLCGG